VQNQKAGGSALSLSSSYLQQARSYQGGHVYTQAQGGLVKPGLLQIQEELGHTPHPGSAACPQHGSQKDCISSIMCYS
jgi:hypothetical protein